MCPARRTWTRVIEPTSRCGGPGTGSTLMDMRTQTTDSLPAPVDAPEQSEQSAQYSLTKILAIWASVTAPMGVLAFVVAPAITPHTNLHPGLVHWILMVVGMIWQFVVSLVVLHRELGGLRWSAVKTRIRWNRPLSPANGRPRRVLWLWAIPAIAANVLGGILALRADEILVAVFPGLSEPWYTSMTVLADPQFEGQWWILGLTVTSLLFNYLLGEELLFRGVLLPRMNKVFGRWDWVANTVLFGLYHVHKIWAWPSMIASSFGMAWAAKRYRSLPMAVLVHGVEGYFIVLVVGILLGWLP